MKDQGHKVSKSTHPVFRLLSEEKVSFTARIIGTVFVALSGGLLYLDKLLVYLNFESDVTFGFSNFSNFLWAFTQSIAPIFMLIGIYLKPHKSSFLIAVYCYGLQIFWIFGSNHSENSMDHFFAFGFCIIFVIIVFFIKRLVVILNKRQNQDQEWLFRSDGATFFGQTVPL